ncbi:hypothetical protein [Vibrio marisflavi]|uniref:hypothetical protein n=1 Tax=Vibrio marisflavi TaxID=1216040 RepID=UPI0025B6B7B3|nr:hypothetical protein [Vibrio marisflavi]
MKHTLVCHAESAADCNEFSDWPTNKELTALNDSSFPRPFTLLRPRPTYLITTGKI